MYHEQLNFCLIMFIILGVPPNKNDILRKLHFSINLICVSTVFFWGIYTLYSKETFKIEYFGEVSTPLTSFPHCIIKLITLFIKKSDIFDLFENSRLRFWELEGTTEIKKIIKLGKIFKNTYLYCMAFFLFLTILKSILLKGLPFKCYEPDWIPTIFLIIFQNYGFCVTMILLASFDVMVLTLLTLVTAQFNMLNEKLLNIFTSQKNEELSSSKIHKRIKECVEHHAFLIDFVEHFKKTFSLTFLLYFGNIIISLCMSNYMVFLKNATIKDYIITCVHTFSGLIEISMCFALPAEILMNEADQVSSSVYHSQWYKYPKCCKDVLPIMIRNQKPTIITAGGFVIIDNNFFVKACKSIFSYSMFLNTMTQLQKE